MVVLLLNILGLSFILELHQASSHSLMYDAYCFTVLCLTHPLRRGRHWSDETVGRKLLVIGILHTFRRPPVREAMTFILGSMRLS